MRQIKAQLLVIAVGMAAFVFLIMPSHPGLLVGGPLLAIGLLQALFYKTSGSRFFAMTQSSWLHVARFWASSGESGTQILFLGIGIILSVAGCVVIVGGSIR